MARSLGQSLTFRLSAPELVVLDELRGSTSRGTLIRGLIAQEAARRKRGGRSSTPPTRAEALALLRDHAQHDANAAVRLEQALAADDTLDRLRSLTAAERPAP